MPSNLSIRRVYWAVQETVTDWEPTAENSAGSFDLATDGALMCGRKTKDGTLLWTTTDLWSMRYIGGQFVYAFKQEGKNCGIISAEAVVVRDTTAYWMGYKQFLMYDGVVNTIPCEVSDYVFGSFNGAQAAKVFAFTNTEFAEVTWHYPSANATECDRYVTFNYLEGHWVFGTLARSCAVAQQVGATSAVPVLVDSIGRIFDHETGSTHTGSTTPSLESGPLELGNGENVVKLQRIVPDDETAGDVNASFYTSMFPNEAETLNGPYTLASPTSLRLTFRQARLKIAQVTAAAWRVGVIRLGYVLGGRR